MPKPIKKEPVQDKQPSEEAQLLHEMKGVKEKKPMKAPKKLIGAAVVIVLFGILSGFALAKISGGGEGGLISGGESNEGKIQKVVGIKDVSGKDEAEGKLLEGGVENEGTHHLERPGGPSQNVYLTSSVVPLDDYIGKNIKVWGDTFAAQSAGWLMDVVKLELLE